MPRNIFETIPCDKRLHTLIGVVAFMLVNMSLRILQIDHTRIISLLSVIVVGILIEVYQKAFNKGVFEFGDIVATVIGGCLGFFSAGISE